jgi:uncharacterized protein YqeY
MSPAEEFAAQLRNELKLAMREEDRAAMKAIRRLLTALSNAEAVPLPDDLETPVVNPGDPVISNYNDVPRRELTADEIKHIVTAELAAHDSVISTFEGLGQHERAAAIRAERETLERYATLAH